MPWPTYPQRTHVGHFHGFGMTSGAGSNARAVDEARRRAKAALALARIKHHLALTKARKQRTKVGNMSQLIGNLDLPEEMTEQSDGIGCVPRVAGLPAYLLTRKGLRSAVVRRRVAAALKAMPPKMRRRVMDRLRIAARARVSGAIRSWQPNVGSHWGHVGSHWGHVGSHYRPQIAGALTP